MDDITRDITSFDGVSSLNPKKPDYCFQRFIYSYYFVASLVWGTLSLLGAGVNVAWNVVQPFVAVHFAAWYVWLEGNFLVSGLFYVYSVFAYPALLMGLPVYTHAAVVLGSLWFTFSITWRVGRRIIYGVKWQYAQHVANGTSTGRFLIDLFGDLIMSITIGDVLLGVSITFAAYYTLRVKRKMDEYLKSRAAKKEDAENESVTFATTTFQSALSMAELAGKINSLDHKRMYDIFTPIMRLLDTLLQLCYPAFRTLTAADAQDIIHQHASNLTREYVGDVSGFHGSQSPGDTSGLGYRWSKYGGSSDESVGEKTIGDLLGRGAKDFIRQVAEDESVFSSLADEGKKLLYSAHSYLDTPISYIIGGSVSAAANAVKGWWEKFLNALRYLRDNVSTVAVSLAIGIFIGIIVIYFKERVFSRQPRPDPKRKPQGKGKRVEDGGEGESDFYADLPPDDYDQMMQEFINSREYYTELENMERDFFEGFNERLGLPDVIDSRHGHNYFDEMTPEEAQYYAELQDAMIDAGDALTSNDARLEELERQGRYTPRWQNDNNQIYGRDNRRVDRDMRYIKRSSRSNRMRRGRREGLEPTPTDMKVAFQKRMRERKTKTDDLRRKLKNLYPTKSSKQTKKSESVSSYSDDGIYDIIGETENNLSNQISQIQQIFEESVRGLTSKMGGLEATLDQLKQDQKVQQKADTKGKTKVKSDVPVSVNATGKVNSHDSSTSTSKPRQTVTGKAENVIVDAKSVEESAYVKKSREMSQKTLQNKIAELNSLINSKLGHKFVVHTNGSFANANDRKVAVLRALEKKYKEICGNYGGFSESANPDDESVLPRSATLDPSDMRTLLVLDKQGAVNMSCETVGNYVVSVNHGFLADLVPGDKVNVKAYRGGLIQDQVFELVVLAKIHDDERGFKNIVVMSKPSTLTAWRTLQPVSMDNTKKTVADGFICGFHSKESKVKCASGVVYDDGYHHISTEKGCSGCAVRDLTTPKFSYGVHDKGVDPTGANQFIPFTKEDCQILTSTDLANSKN